MLKGVPVTMAAINGDAEAVGWPMTVVATRARVRITVKNMAVVVECGDEASMKEVLARMIECKFADLRFSAIALGPAHYFAYREDLCKLTASGVCLCCGEGR